MKKYIGDLLIIASFGILFYTVHSQKRQIEALKLPVSNSNSLHRVIDSLNNELFIKHLETDRYEIALEMLKEQDPKAADEFEKCLHNTE